MVTLAQIAQRAGVSAALVSVVLNGKAEKVGISKKRVEEVLRIAREMNYRPNSAARAIQSNRSKLVGVLLHNEPDQRLRFHEAYELILGINDRLQQDDYVLCMIRIEDIQVETSDESRVFRERLLDGMIVMDALPDNVNQHVEETFPTCVWLETNVWREKNCLRRDEVACGKLAAEAAIQRGYRRLAMVTHNVDEIDRHYSTWEREEGAQAAASAAGVPLEFIRCTGTIGTLHFPALQAFADGHLKQTPRETCVVAYDTRAAEGVSHAAAALGLVPGKDFGLVCCDDSARVQECWPTLTRISNDRIALGEQGAELVLEALRRSPETVPSRKVGGQFIPGNTLPSLC